jgi:carotenoid cleavage dioxygenase-like enzyme
MESTLGPAKIADYRLGFTTLDREIVADSLPVTGAIPDWLSGSLLRNGPARFEVGADLYRHWFDGLAMLHRFTIAEGRVSYANRFLRSPGFLEAERIGRIARPEFATDPQRSLVEQIVALFGGGGSDNANVNVVPFGDGYLALTETPSPVAFDGTTLQTRGVLDYDDDVRGQVTTAHTHHDRERRATFNIVTEFGRQSRYHVVRIEDGTLARTVVASIAVDEPAYLHAFSTTGRYVVIAEYPFVVRAFDLLLHRKPYIDNYRWEAGRGARFHVVGKDDGAIAGTYEADAFFAFHHINAFDDGDAVVLDIAAYDDATIIEDFMMRRLLDAGAHTIARAAFRRYRLVPGRREAEVEDVASAETELPRIAPARAGKTYRYAYGVDIAADRPGAFINQLVKIDVRERSVTRWSAPNAYPGEPVFVPRPGAVDEDDGVVLSVVLDANAATSYLLVLDARTLGETARIVVPHHIPFGFHGLFR